MHQVAGHAREHQQLGRLQLDQRADDLVHVAARAEVAAGALHDDAMHVAGVAQLAEQVAQFGVGREGQRVLALGPVQRDDADAVLDLPGEVLRPGSRPARGGCRR